jgi:type IV pilus assembly protein PilC
MAINTSTVRQTGAGRPDRPAAQQASAVTASGWGRRPSGRDLIYFASQLSLMLEVGTSLTDAVAALEPQTANPVLRRILQELQHEMEEGQSFSIALSRHDRVFDGVFISMVRAGETGGYLKDALNRIVEMREKKEALVSQVRAAMTYPMILTVVAFFVVVFIVTGVLPKFMPLFAGKEAILPASTRFLLALSQSLRGYWWLWILGGGAIATAGTFFSRSSPGRWLHDWLSISLPVVGPLTNKVLTGQLLRTLGHLLESHVALTDALKVTRLTLQNRFYSGLVDRVELVVESGGRLSQAFLEFKHMQPSVRQMIATGEESGNLYPVMLRLAHHYDTEIEQQLKRLASLIEPLALIVLGAVVGLVVASVILPLFKMAHAIG